jgi:cytochrome c-type biogenesis protein CcmH/NrfG
VARGSQHLRKRPVQDAPKPSTRGRRRPNELEEELFFERLRRHAKWAFVLLAIVFALSFALLGVGSGNSGLGDLFQGIVGQDTPSSDISKLQEQTRKNPRSATAFRELATALETDGRNEEAIVALRRYTTLQPKDTDAVQELAGLYQSRAEELNSQIREIEAEAAPVSRSIFVPTSETTVGKLYADTNALGDPIEQAITTLVSSRTSELSADLQQVLANAVATYKRLVLTDPANAQLQLQLGLAAQQAGDVGTVISAWGRFLELAPDDPSAPQIREALAQLTAQSAPAAGGG